MSTVPDHILNVRTNLSQIVRLLDIHTHLTGAGPGRRRDVQVLNKSAVLLLVATWEAYVEDLAISACRFAVENAESFDQLPKLALVKTSRRLEKEQDDNSIWKLAGDGWKNELIAQAELEASRLNSPDAEKVDILFDNTLGLRKLSKYWYWAGSSRENVTRRLSRLIETRGEIAHRVEASDPVTKTYVERNVDLVKRLGAISSNRVRGHISNLVGMNPWPRYGHSLAS
ncbi:MAG: hypothetical protein KAV87_42815 [Desulfobacteraceae bacterium]|nr:hypothetical protein [Desulfobacteraceae bacterium]